MARDRDDRDDEDEDDRPRRRSRRDEDDEDADDRPRRRRRRDDDDYDDRPREELGPLDKTFRDTNMVVLVLFAVCCNGVALILGIIGLVTAKDQQAKSNAMLVTIIGAVVTVIGGGIRIAGVLNR
jgi:hypothetical protein